MFITIYISGFINLYVLVVTMVIVKMWAAQCDKNKIMSERQGGALQIGRL